MFWVPPNFVGVEVFGVVLVFWVGCLGASVACAVFAIRLARASARLPDPSIPLAVADRSGLEVPGRRLTYLLTVPPLGFVVVVVAAILFMLVLGVPVD